MTALTKRIAERISTEGPIGIAEFMTYCLHDPEYGAYASRSPIGAGGDYITSPEISQTFGEMCGLWIVQSWHNQGRPGAPLLVELGPGRGTMMKDVLRTIQAAARKFFVDAKIVLVEASPVLRAQQEQLLKPLAPAPISWVGSIDGIASDRPVYLFSNEFFDCLPIRQYVKRAEGWCEKVIAVDKNELTLALKRLPVPEAVLPPGYQTTPENGVCEVCPAGAAMAEDISRAVARHGGAALLIDYGYVAPTYAETLQSVQRHKYADVLATPGDSDLSAHVDFAALARAAEKGGARVSGPIEQGDFLAALGIEVRARKLMLANPDAAKQIVAGVKRLIDPGEMGSLFKVLALTAQGSPLPPGFPGTPLP